MLEFKSLFYELSHPPLLPYYKSMNPEFFKWIELNVDSLSQFETAYADMRFFVVEKVEYIKYAEIDVNGIGDYRIQFTHYARHD